MAFNPTREPLDIVRLAFYLGALTDGLAVVPMLFPSIGIALFGGDFSQMTDAYHYAMDPNYYDKPNKLLKQIEKRYDISDPNVADTVEDKFGRFVMNPNEVVATTKTRLDDIVRQLREYKIMKTDREIRKTFLKALPHNASAT